MSQLNKQLLVVDDEPEILESLGLLLEVFGYQVRTASSGREAWELFEKDSFDLVITDINMPKGNGLELLQKIRQHPVRSQTPVLVISGHSEQNLDQLYSSGASGFFAKPFESTALRSSIEMNLEPLIKRWSRSPLEAKAELSLQELDMTKKTPVEFGRLGFFLENQNLGMVRVGDPLRFSLELQAPVGRGLEVIEGVGVIRWARRQGTADLRLGFGVEIQFLNETCREAYWSEISSQPGLTSIPLGKKAST